MDQKLKEIENNNKDKLDKTQIQNIDSCYDLLINSPDAIKYLTKYKGYLKEYFLLNSNQCKEMNELYLKLEVESCEQTFSNTPLNEMESIIKNIIQIQMKNFNFILSKTDLFNSLYDKIKEFQTIIEESSIKYSSNNLVNKSIIGETNNVFNAMMETMKDLEIKVVDEYIWEKYQKRAAEAGDKSSKDLVSDMKYLEETLFNFVQGKKMQFYKRFKEPNDKIQNVFNEIKNCYNDYISCLKDINKNILNEYEKLEQLIKTNSLIEDNNSEIKSGFNLKENDFYTVKYKIKIIKGSKIDLKPPENNNNDNINNIKNINEQKLIKFNEKNLFLTEKDKFEIISKLYSFDLKILDTSQYDLDIEKEKFIAFDISNEILLYSGDEENIKNKLKEKSNELIETIENKILNNIKNIESFFLALNNYRAKGNVKVNDKFYEFMVYIYSKAQDMLLKINNKKLEDLMLILSRTYYKEVKDNKIYIVNAIKAHTLYKNKEFWKAIVIRQIEDEFKVMRNFNSSNNTTNVISPKRKEEIIVTKLVPFSDLLKDFDFNKEQINEILNIVFEKYKCSDKTKQQVFSFIGQI